MPEDTTATRGMTEAELNGNLRILNSPLVGALPAGVPFALANTNKHVVMCGEVYVCTARSKTMAKRICNALNEHIVNREGV
jgi:hypothetical protein